MARIEKKNGKNGLDFKTSSELILKTVYEMIAREIEVIIILNKYQIDELSKNIKVSKCLNE
jgi:hypothetical protein